MNVTLGTNDFFGVPFPLVLADRFFHIYSTASGLKLDIFRWDETSKQAIYEVKGSKPLTDNITTNPTGIVTFSEPSTGTFLYKFRPKPEISQIFGRILANNENKEFEVKIDDRHIEVIIITKTSNTFEKNQVTGYPIGMQIDVTGSIAIGSNRLPEGMILKRGEESDIEPK